MAINSKIYPLVGNENALGLRQIESLVRRKVVGREELRCVLCDELLAQCNRYLDGELKRAVIGAGSASARLEKDRTEVYFWGVQGSGRSTVIGSLLATEYVRVAERVDDADAAMCRDMQAVFAETGDCVVLPEFRVPAGACDIARAVNVEMSYPNGRRHPLTLVEAKAVGNTITFPAMLQKPSANDKIHIICYDGTRESAAQDNALMELLDELERWKVLETSVGIYLLVTKIDSNPMVPRAYRAQSAQSMITTRHQELWYAVKAKCYRMNIYDATPVPFCVGDVKLQGLVTVDLTYARHLAERPLLLKSNPYRTAVEKVLRSGNKWLTLVLLFVAIAGLAYGVIFALEQLEPKPDSEIAPYDFKADFERRMEKCIYGKGYSRDFAWNFNKLAIDIVTERFLVDRDSVRLVDADDVDECDSLLNNAVAKTVCRRADEEFEGSKWNSDTLTDLKFVCREIKVSKHLSGARADDVDRVTNVIADYYAALKLIAQSGKCVSMANVDYVINHKDDFCQTVRNDTSVNNGLKNIREAACCSFANHLNYRVNLMYQEFRNRWSGLRWYKNAGSRRRDLKYSYSGSIYSYRLQLDELEQRLPDGSAAAGVISSVRSTLSSIENY